MFHSIFESYYHYIRMSRIQLIKQDFEFFYMESKIFKIKISLNTLTIFLGKKKY